MTTTLLFTLLAGFLGPVITGVVPKLRLSPIILLIVLGILLGPSGYNLIQPQPILNALSRIGLAFLFFQVGLEVNFVGIKGRPLLWGIKGWLLSLGIAYGLCSALAHAGLIKSPLLVMAALATSSLGSILPILKGAGLDRTRFGTYVIAAATVGEFAPLLLITELLPEHRLDGSISHNHAFLLVLVATLSLGIGFVARLRPPQFLQKIMQSFHASDEVPVRLSILILSALTLLTSDLGFESIIGSLTAGLLVRMGVGKEHRQQVIGKLETIAYGVFIPIFFVHVGVMFDLEALLSSTAAMTKVPLFLIMLLLIRGLPVYLLREGIPRSTLLPIALMSSTTLTLVIAVSHIGLSTHQLERDTAIALISAAMLGKILFPSLALFIKSGRRGRMEQDHG